MKIEFCVIVHTPDLLEQGNMAHNFMYDGWDFCNDRKIMCIGFTDKGKQSVGECLTPVFEEGEIVICNVENGREVCYPGRKPTKWDVVYEVFDNLDDAVKRAEELL